MNTEMMTKQFAELFAASLLNNLDVSIKFEINDKVTASACDYNVDAESVPAIEEFLRVNQVLLLNNINGLGSSVISTEGIETIVYSGIGEDRVKIFIPFENISVVSSAKNDIAWKSVAVRANLNKPFMFRGIEVKGTGDKNFSNAVCSSLVEVCDVDVIPFEHYQTKQALASKGENA